MERHSDTEIEGDTETERQRDRNSKRHGGTET